MMRKLLILLLLAGCAPLTRPQAKSLVPEGITSEVRWYSIRGNPWADGERIYVDLDWVAYQGLNGQLDHLLWHEEYHNLGLGHCLKKKCLMYYMYQMKNKRLCLECERKSNDK